MVVLIQTLYGFIKAAKDKQLARRWLLVICLVLPVVIKAQPNRPQLVAGIPVNYDEAKTGEYTLPDPLRLNNGKKVKDKKTWLNKRRPEILSMLENIQFGKAPGKPGALRFDVFEKGTPVFNGKAIRRQVRIYFTNDTAGPHKMDMVMYVPSTGKPSPLLLALSFSPNFLAINDPGIRPGMVWRNGKKVMDTSSRFPKLNVEPFINSGIGYANIYYADIEPDVKNGLTWGIRSVYLKNGQQQVAPNEWGAVSAWSWGLSRAMDYLETDKDINSKQVAITGASRLGKTVLWTGARDTRFAMVIASVSGECGAALSRRNYGETIAHMTDTSRYFYQFAPNYHDYSNKVYELPFDSHMLIAMVAPRPLLLQTGSTDYWSDPKGEYLAAQAAQPVLDLFGLKGVGDGPFPNPGDDSKLESIGYYMHHGGHTVTNEDRAIFIRYMIKHFNIINL